MKLMKRNFGSSMNAITGMNHPLRRILKNHRCLRKKNSADLRNRQDIRHGASATGTRTAEIRKAWHTVNNREGTGKSAENRKNCPL